MDKVIIVLVILGVAMLAGSGIANSVSLDFSAGPHAEGDQAIQEAQATRIKSQTDTDQANADQKLVDQQLIDEQTRADRVRTVKIIQWVLGIAGGGALVLVLIFAAVNISAFMSLINFRFAVMPIAVRSESQVGWILPLVPNVLYLTSDDAPGVVTKLTAHDVPRISEPYQEVGLAVASALKRPRSITSDDSTIPEGFMQSISQMLNGIPNKRLSAPMQE